MCKYAEKEAHGNLGVCKHAIIMDALEREGRYERKYTPTNNTYQGRAGVGNIFPLLIDCCTIAIRSPSTEEEAFVFAKGAPETIKSFLSSPSPTYDETYRYFMRQGYRVIALAYRRLGRKPDANVRQMVPIVMLKMMEIKKIVGT